MEYIIEPMFSIPVYKILLNGLSDEMNLELFLREELENNPNEEKNDNEVEQTYPDLHLKKEMQPLCDNIFKAVECILNDVLFIASGYQVDITAMWANKQKPNQQFHHHRHHNNILSGVFYANEGDSFPPITFYNPVDPQLCPTHIGKYNQFNSISYSQSTIKNMLLIFPAYLDHSVAINESDKERISVSFNVILRGQYEHPKTLQSVQF